MTTTNPAPSTALTRSTAPAPLAHLGHTPSAASSAMLFPAPDEWDRMLHIAKSLADAKVGPEEVQGDPGKLLTIILKGWELGLPPMQALEGIYIIKGKPAIAASLLSSLAQTRVPGCRIDWIDDGTKGRAEVAVYRAGRNPVRLAVTRDEISQLGIDKSKDGVKDNWRKFPAAMLRAFVLRNAIRMQCPEVLYGLDVVVDGDVVEMAGEAAVVTAELVSGGAPTEPAPPPVATVPPPQAAASGAVPAREAPEDYVLPMPGGKFKDKKLSACSPADLAVLRDGYEKAVAEAMSEEAMADKKTWLARVAAWAEYRKVGA